MQSARVDVKQTTTHPVRVLQVTDPHLFADSAASLRGIVTHTSLTAVLDHFRHGGWAAHVVAVTGDLIQDDSADAYRHFCNLLGALELPVHCVPGNHDTRTLMQEALSAPPFHYCGTYCGDAWAIVGIDSCVSGSAGGQISAAELLRLGDEIEQTTAPHVLVCLHHPPLPLRSRWLDQVGLTNGPQFLASLASSGKVRGCLFGHAHQPFDETHEGMRIIGTPSTCRQFLPGSDEFALDDRPPAYRRVLLQADGTIDTELVWLPPAEQTVAHT